MKNTGYEIRPLQLEDAENIRIARNEQMDVLRQSHEISKEEQIHYFKHTVVPNSTKPYPDLVLYSFLKNGAWIGYGGLTHIDWHNKRAEISFLVETARTKVPENYGQDFENFLKILSREAFNTFQLHRLFTETFDFRKDHIKILENFGFIQEGILREHILINGKFENSIMHGLLKKDHNNDL
jgi:RimJ/RimL family protein N-acetyltransferase